MQEFENKERADERVKLILRQDRIVYSKSTLRRVQLQAQIEWLVAHHHNRGPLEMTTLPLLFHKQYKKALDYSEHGYCDLDDLLLSIPTIQLGSRADACCQTSTPADTQDSHTATPTPTTNNRIVVTDKDETEVCSVTYILLRDQDDNAPTSGIVSLTIHRLLQHHQVLHHVPAPKPVQKKPEKKMGCSDPLALHVERKNVPPPSNNPTKSKEAVHGFGQVGRRRGRRR